MDRVTIRYAAAAAIILATVTIAVSAFAESGQPEVRPVRVAARTSAVAAVTGLAAPRPFGTQIPVSSSAAGAPVLGTADPAGAEDVASLYAPPVRSPWWERLLASRAFLYIALSGLIVVPAAGFAASAIIVRRGERGLALDARDSQLNG